MSNAVDITTDTDLDPRAAWQFAVNMGQLADMLLAKLDAALGDLGAKKVSGEPLAAIARMVDSASAFKAEAGIAAGFFQQHISVQEQVEATPSVGGDEYLRGNLTRR
uniref:hypothetical protein n=1 Tax=Saccharothrix espanaensis TaxID=103731 RepID=UPI003F494691